MSSREYGIWIDQREARVVALDGGDASVRTVPSEVEFVHPGGGSPGITAKGRRRSHAGARSAGPQVAVPEDRIERRRHADLDRFYREVAEEVRGARAIYIAGPGEAPGAFAKVLGQSVGTDTAILDVVPMGRMTEPEWIAHVRAVFGREPPRVSTAAPGTPTPPEEPS